MKQDQTEQQLEQAALDQQMGRIRRKLLVLSGKGGVGKSTVAANLAVALAATGKRVGLLDVDVHGPSIPRLMGLQTARAIGDDKAMQPVRVSEKLAVMSIGFLLASGSDAVIWRGPMKYGMIRRFLTDVAWGELDYLVVDSPPGTGDEPLAVAQLVGPGAEAVIVTTPQDLATADVRRSIDFCRKLSLPVAGLIENMSGMLCPHCGERIDLFTTGGGESLAGEMGIRFLGAVPLDPRIVLSGDAGTPFMQCDAQSPVAGAFSAAIEPILAARPTAPPEPQPALKEIPE